MLITRNNPQSIIFVNPTWVWVEGKKFKTVAAALRGWDDETEPLKKMLEELDRG